MEIPTEKLKEADEVRDIFWKVLSKKNLFEVDENGRILFAGFPYILLESSFFYIISQQINKLLGPVQKRIWYEFGVTAGKDIALKVTDKFQKSSLIGALETKLKTGLSFKELLKLKGKGIETLAGKMWGYGSYSGWVGEIENIKIDPEKPEIVLRVVNGFETRGYILRKVKVGEPTCHFLAGVSAGLFSYWLKKDLRGEETKCQSKGDPFCEIRICSAEE